MFNNIKFYENLIKVNTYIIFIEINTMNTLIGGT